MHNINTHKFTIGEKNINYIYDINKIMTILMWNMFSEMFVGRTFFMRRFSLVIKTIHNELINKRNYTNSRWFWHKKYFWAQIFMFVYFLHCAG